MLCDNRGIIANMHKIKPEQLPLPKDFADGSVFHGYLIGDRIGAGGFGRVFHCTKLEPNQPPKPFAMKVLTLRNDDSAQIRQQMLINNEIGVMKKISHENVLKLEHSFTHEEGIYNFTFLVLPLCNSDLRQYLKEHGALSEFKLVYFMRQMISAFMALDLNKVIHRDIKLENIFWIKETDKVVIGDFGLAKHGVEWTKTICGTRSKVSPEIQLLMKDRSQLKDQFEGYDDKVDVYSLGVVFYELLTGKRENKSVSEMIVPHDKIQTQLQVGQEFKFGPQDAVNPLIKDLLEGMLEVNSINRLSWHQIADHALFKEKLVDLSLGAIQITDGAQLLDTFVDHQSFICHVEDLQNHREFTKQKVSYNAELHVKAEAIFANAAWLRDLLNRVVQKYFEIGKKFFNRNLVQRQLKISVPASLKHIQEDIEIAAVNALVYFSKVFPEMISICENLLDRCPVNEESVSFNGLNTKAKELWESMKGGFDPKLVQTAEAETNLSDLSNTAYAKCLKICDEFLTRVTNQDGPAGFEAIMMEIAANLYFLVKFTKEYFSNTAVTSPEWKHTLEEFLYNADPKIALAFQDRLFKQTQANLTSF